MCTFMALVYVYDLTTDLYSEKRMKKKAFSMAIKPLLLLTNYNTHLNPGFLHHVFSKFYRLERLVLSIISQ